MQSTTNSASATQIEQARRLHQHRSEQNALLAAGRVYFALAVAAVLWPCAWLLTEVSNEYQVGLLALPWLAALVVGYRATIRGPLERLRELMRTEGRDLPPDVDAMFDRRAVSVERFAGTLGAAFWAVLVFCPLGAAFAYGLLFLGWNAWQRL